MQSSNYIYPWQKVPVSRLIIPFALGIISAFQIPDLSFYWLILPVLLLLGCILFEKTSTVKIFKYRQSYAFLISLTLTISVIFLHKSYVSNNKPYHFSKHINSNSYVIARLTEMPEEREKSIKCVLKVKAVVNNQQIIHYNGKLLAYFQKGTKSDKLFYNDIVILKAKIIEVPYKLNPAQFDYKKFLGYKRIYHQVFLKDSNWILSKSKPQFNAMLPIMKLRVSILKEIEKAVQDKGNRAIASALLVGYKTELSDEVTLSFVSTGAMHVLAVSGLHVGIIFIVFSFITKFLKRLRYGKLLFVFTNLFLLWCYALITGGSPSVLRATTMFSFVLVGLNVGRIPNIYSSLYTSFIILLLLNPLMISQVGFQLSYVAVIGIVALQPRIYQLVNLKKIWIADKIWSLTAVSLAAQLATFPLGLFYFTQFPVYFLISNLVVIPAATLIIYLGFAFLITIPIGLSWLSNIFSYILNLLLWLLHHSVTYIQNWPNGIIDEVYISLFMTILLYLFVAFIVLFLIKHQRKYLLYLLFVTFLIISGYTFWEIKNKTETKTIIYSVKNHSLIGFFYNGKITFWGDSNLLSNYENLKYNTFRDVWKYGKKSEDMMKVNLGSHYSDPEIFIRKNYCLFQNTVFVIADEINNRKPPLNKFRSNYLIIRPGTKTYASKMLDFYQTDMVIVNGYENSRKMQKTKETLDRHKIKMYNLTENGALIYNFNRNVDFNQTIGSISFRIRELCGIK